MVSDRSLGDSVAVAVAMQKPASAGRPRRMRMREAIVQGRSDMRGL
jgi:hypothetical protein